MLESSILDKIDLERYFKNFKKEMLENIDKDLTDIYLNKKKQN